MALDGDVRPARQLLGDGGGCALGLQAERIADEVVLVAPLVLREQELRAESGEGVGGVLGEGLRSRPRRLASKPMVGPWITLEARTTKKTMLNMAWASSTPATMPKVARTIGTAPRRPAQDTNSLARQSNWRKGARQMKTLAGLAMSISTAVMARPSRATPGS